MQGRDWRSAAVCRDVDPEMFFPVAAPGTSAYGVEVARAKRVCAGCPVRVREQCLEFALIEMPDGVAGGLTEYERAAVRQARKAASVPAAAGLRDVELVVAEAARSGAARAERVAAVLALLEDGLTVVQAAARLGVTERTAGRWLAQHRADQAAAVADADPAGKDAREAAA